jgi:hypothetical protein
MMELSQVASILRSTPQTLRVLLHDVDRAVLIWRPAPGEWCINEVVGHLIEADRQAFMVRIKGMLKAEHYEIQAVDADEIAAKRRDNEREVFDLIDELARQRETCSELVLGLSPEDIERSGEYPPHGEFRIADFVHEWAFHDCDHLQQILGNLKTRIWPHMGTVMQCALSRDK